MKRIYGFALCLTLFSAEGVMAETLYLKSGLKLEGKIIERTDELIKIDTSGLTVTYFADEIDRIEGEAVPKGFVPSSPAVREISQEAQTQADSKIPLPSPATPVDTVAQNLTKKELILRFMKSSGTLDAMNQMFSQLIAQAPAAEAQQLQGVLNIDEIAEVLVPIYDKYFTQEDLRSLINFHESPLGKKLLEVTPNVMQESIQASSLYFQAKMPAKSLP